MKIVFIGTVAFSRVVLLRVLSLKANVVGIITKEHSEFNSDHTDLSDIATSAGIPWKWVRDVNHANNLAWIRSFSPDVIFCFGWSSLLKKELLMIPPLGVVGFHPTLLPFNRGRHPIIWALVLGLKRTGATFFFMDEGADSGDILSQQEVAIRDEDNAQSLYDRITDSALLQIDQFVPALQNNTYRRVKQDISRGNVWRKRDAKDGKIDWRMNSKGIYDLVRALYKPYPGATTTFRGEEVEIWEVKITNSDPDLVNIEPGKVLEVKDGRVLVKTGDGAVWILQHEFKSTVSVGEYLI